MITCWKPFAAGEWSELGSRDMDCIGRMVMRPRERERASHYNLYRYCHNDPVNHVDPFGLQDYKPVTAFSKDGKYETVRFTTVSRSALGSNLRPLIHWEVKREQHDVEHVYKDGKPAAALTKADSSSSGNSITWHINVEYNQKDFGDRWRAFARENEHDHADAILNYAMSNRAYFAAADAFLGGRLDSAARALLANKVAEEQAIDLITERHTLKENGRVVPDNQ